jgi:hypothetical protein
MKNMKKTLVIFLVFTLMLGVISVAAEPDPVTIDLKPNSFPNSINLGSKGRVPVAVLTTADFDATTVDPVSVVFAGADPLRWTWEDIDSDGDVDVLFFFKTRELVLLPTSIEATLTGETYDGVVLAGTDSVNIVP